MNSPSTSKEILQKSFLLLLLAGSMVAASVAQEKPKTAPAPRPSAPHISAARPSTQLGPPLAPDPTRPTSRSQTRECKA